MPDCQVGHYIPLAHNAACKASLTRSIGWYQIQELQSSIAKEAMMQKVKPWGEAIFSSLRLLS
jgi:hypothetical protein